MAGRPDRRLRRAAAALLLAAGGGLLAAAPARLELLTPNGRGGLTAGSPFVIRWNAVGVDAPLQLVLLRQGREVGVIAGPLAAARGECAWVVGRVRGGLAPAGPGYTVCVQTEDGALTDSSDAAFAIRAEPRLRSVMLVPRIINAHRRNRWNNGHDQCLFNPQTEAAALPEEPPAWTARAGYRNSFRTWNECRWYDGLVFRAFLYFDLPPDAAGARPLQAEFFFERQDDAPPNCAPWPLRLYAVTESWSGPGTPRAPDFAVELQSGRVELTGLVRSWLEGGWAAHGLLVCGPDESFAHDNEYRLADLTAIGLQVEYMLDKAPPPVDPNAPFRP